MTIYVRFSILLLCDYNLLIMGMELGNSQLAIHCMEDSQCSSGLFCDNNAYSCIKCVNCEEHRREPPALFNRSTCLKSHAECGPCFKGFVKVYQEASLSAKCMSPDAQGHTSWSHLVIWLAAMIASVIVIGTFVLVLRTTNIYKIHKKVSYYTHTLFFRVIPIANNVPSLPPTYDFKTAIIPNAVSTFGFDYMTPTKCFDVITELNTEKLGRCDIDSMTSLVLYKNNESST